MNEDIEPIRHRALRFAATLVWVDPVIVDVRPADAEVVADRGSGDVTAYRTFRIELQMSGDRRKLATGATQPTVRQRLNVSSKVRGHST